MRCKGGVRGSTSEAAKRPAGHGGRGRAPAHAHGPRARHATAQRAGGGGAAPRAACLALALYVMLRPSKKGVRTVILQTTFPQMFEESVICGPDGNVCACCDGCQCLRVPMFCTTLGAVLVSEKLLLPRSGCPLARFMAAYPTDGICPLRALTKPPGGAAASIQGSKFRCLTQ